MKGEGGRAGAATPLGEGQVADTNGCWGGDKTLLGEGTVGAINGCWVGIRTPPGGVNVGGLNGLWGGGGDRTPPGEGTLADANGLGDGGGEKTFPAGDGRVKGVICLCGVDGITAGDGAVGAINDLWVGSGDGTAPGVGTVKGVHGG